MYSKTCLKQPLSKRPKIGFQDQLLFIAGQKYCRMLQGEHSAILLTFIKLPFVIKIFVFFSILIGRLKQVLLYILGGVYIWILGSKIQFCNGPNFFHAGREDSDFGHPPTCLSHSKVHMLFAWFRRAVDHRVNVLKFEHFSC